MKSLEQWMTLYGRDHQNPLNQKIHKICVPLIMWSLLGILWAIPRPDFFSTAAWLNWSTLFCVLCLVFYLLISVRAFLLMLIVSAIMLSVIYWAQFQLDLMVTSITIFVLAWLGQFYGHKVEGQKPSFLEDIQFLLIGPLWVFKPILEKKSHSLN